MTRALEAPTRADLEHRLHASTQFIIGLKNTARRRHGPCRAEWPANLRQQIDGAKRACKFYRTLLEEQPNGAVA